MSCWRQNWSGRVSRSLLDGFDSLHVLVATAGQIHDEDRPAREAAHLVARPLNRMRRFERRENTFRLTEPLEAGERAAVVDPGVLGPSARGEPCVLRSDRGIVEAG